MERLFLLGSAGLTREFSLRLRTILVYREPGHDGKRQIAVLSPTGNFVPREEPVGYR